MKKIISVPFFLLLFQVVTGQEFSAKKLIDLLSLSLPKFESQLQNKKFHTASLEMFGDTAVKTYEYRSSFRGGRKGQSEFTKRKILRSSLKETFTLTYQTGLSSEYHSIIEDLKKTGFYCEYEKDSTLIVSSHLYQHEDYTADAAILVNGTDTAYSITFFKKILPVEKDLHFAEDLLDFTSHEYLVYYFGINNVKKDIYYFSGKDIVNCSVLFINTKRQVIFIWKDGLNKRKIDNIMLGGEQKLKSQQGYDKFTAENNWLLKTGLHAGMPLFELRTLNGANIGFCGGDAANPGLIVSGTDGKVDFKNSDIILGCMNCTDDKFMQAKMLYADKAMMDGRVLFVLTIVLYPADNGVFD